MPDQKRTISIFIETGNAQKAYDVLLKKEKELKEAFDKATDPKQAAALKAQLDKLAEPLDRAAKKAKGELSASFTDVKRTVDDLGKRLKKMSTEDADYTKVLKQYNQANIELAEQRQKIDAVKKAQGEMQENALSFGNVFKRTAEYFGAFEIVSKVSESVKEFLSGTIEEADQAQEAVDGLRVALENSGRGELLQPLLKQADDFAEKFKRLDNDDITSVFTKLVDYGKLTQNQMTDVTQVIIDFAAKQKISLGESTDTITKALSGSAKALKTYGIDMSNAKTFTERYNIVVDELGKKVQGAEAAFEETSKGIRETFAQSIRNAQEAIGSFVFDILDGAESAETLFDAAKQQTDNYTQSLEPLLSRYDELKGKTKLNKDEQLELQGIIQKIVEVVPSAATEINKYGVALDINKQKVTDFLNENKKFLAEKEFKAVQETNERAVDAWRRILKISADLKKNTIEVTDEMGRSFTRTLTVDEQRQRLSNLRTLQQQFLQDSQTLVDKYGKTLNKQSLDFVNAIKAELNGIKAAEANIPQKPIGTGKETPEEKEARLAREKQADEDRKQREREAEAERKQTIEDQKKLNEELQKLSDDYAGINQSQYQRDLQTAFEKYEGLKKLAHGNKDELQKIETGMNEALLQINKKYADKALEELKKQDEEKRKLHEKQLQDQLQKGLQFLNSIARDATQSAGNSLALRRAQQDYEIAVSFGKKKFEKQKEQLQDEEALAKEAARQKGESIEAVEEQFRLKRLHLEDQYLEQQINQYFSYGQQILGILSSIDAIKTSKENAELARDERIHDKKKANLDKRLKAGLITQKEYDRQAEQLDKEQDKKKHEIEVRQFKRQQKMQITQALMSGAQAVASTIAALPGPFDIATLGIARAIQIGLMIAATAAQVATIASQKPPEYAHGGQVLNGPSHKEGGIHVVAEGGEAFVNKKTMSEKNTYQVSGTPSSIISWLNGLHGVSWDSSASGRPLWSTSKPQPMNHSGINSSIDSRRLYFANGGVVPEKAPAAGSGGGSVSLPDEFYHMMAMINNTLGSVQTTLAAIQRDGVQVPVTRINDAQARLAAIQDDATMK